MDLPTPPFPEATTNTWLTPAMGHFLGRPLRMASSEDAELKRRNNQPHIFARTMLVPCLYHSLTNQIHLCMSAYICILEATPSQQSSRGAIARPDLPFYRILGCMTRNTNDFSHRSTPLNRENMDIVCCSWIDDEKVCS